MVTPIILISACVLTTILFLVVRVKVGGVWGVATKTLASFMFVVTALVGLVTRASTISSMFIVLGLICGLIGDIVLDLKVVYQEHNDFYLNMGMLSFSIGHIFYFVALFMYLNNDINFISSSTPLYIPILIGIGVALLLCGGILLSSKLMKLDFGKFFLQSAGYSILLTSLASISILLAVFYTSTLWVFGIGAIAFLISDLILSLNYFGGQANNKLLILLNHITYYIAQILIATFLFII